MRKVIIIYLINISVASIRHVFNPVIANYYYYYYYDFSLSARILSTVTITHPRYLRERRIEHWVSNPNYQTLGFEMLVSPTTQAARGILEGSLAWQVSL